MPRLTDDGTLVTLDLHGARIDDALDLVRRTLGAAAQRGRASLRIVHGSSTSDPRAHNRTIKHALHDLLDDGAFPHVTDALRSEDMTLLSLPLGAPQDRTPLRLQDLR